MVKDPGLTWVWIPAPPLIISYVTSVSRLNFSEHSLPHVIKVPLSGLWWEIKGTMQVWVLTECYYSEVSPSFNRKLNGLPNYYSEALAFCRIFVLILSIPDYFYFSFKPVLRADLPSGSKKPKMNSPHPWAWANSGLGEGNWGRATFCQGESQRWNFQGWRVNLQNWSGLNTFC